VAQLVVHAPSKLVSYVIPKFWKRYLRPDQPRARYEWVGARKQFTRDAAIGSPPLQHSLRKYKLRDPRRKQAEMGNISVSQDERSRETEYKRNWTELNLYNEHPKHACMLMTKGNRICFQLFRLWKNVLHCLLFSGMGYDVSLVRDVIQRSIEQHEEEHQSTTALLEAVREAERWGSHVNVMNFRVLAAAEKFARWCRVMETSIKVSCTLSSNRTIRRILKFFLFQLSWHQRKQNSRAADWGQLSGCFFFQRGSRGWGGKPGRYLRKQRRLRQS